ncbi:MAG: adenylyltransferase/cytidyltransferase family protein [Candidatus Daviesbacteria bacterium]|nr:adenylyltransferase/cytidyltransferase family protein [Candidatus Daviesbacteria bacterium]
MAEIISINKINSLCDRLKKQDRVVVLAGGCFDVLHPGHVTFLEKAKKAGDILVVLLESDEKIKTIKGVNRPVHTQSERAKVLSALAPIDYIVKLPYFKKDLEYDRLISKIKPGVIAATSKIKNIRHYRRAAQLAGAKLKFVTKTIGSYSTSSLIGSIAVQ